MDCAEASEEADNLTEVTASMGDAMFLLMQLMKRQGSDQAGGLLVSDRQGSGASNPASPEPEAAMSARARSTSVNFESLSFRCPGPGEALPGADPATENLCERLKKGELQCVEERHLQMIDQLVRKADFVTQQIQRKFQ